MKFSEYMIIRNGFNRKGKLIKAISRKECNYLNIEQTSGWYENNADIEITEEQYYILLNMAKMSKSKHSKTTKRVDITKKKYLYFMRSDSGIYKIGISSNPARRKIDLQNGTGTKIKIVCCVDTYWSSYDVEQFLLNKFKEHKTYGEWVKFPDSVEPCSLFLESIPCNYDVINIG